MKNIVKGQRMNMAEMNRMAGVNQAATAEQVAAVDGVPMVLYTVLEQWGKWNRDRGGYRSTSSSQLGIFRDNRCPACYEGEACAACLMQSAGKVRLAPLVQPVEVEKAVLQLPEKYRELLRAHFHRQANARMTARVLRIPFGAYTLNLRTAALMVRNTLVRGGARIEG